MYTFLCPHFYTRIVLETVSSVFRARFVENAYPWRRLRSKTAATLVLLQNKLQRLCDWEFI
jgi:hypothetical protein